MPSTLRLTAGVSIQAAAGDSKKPPRIEAVVYSGGVMRPAGWGDLVVDLSGLELPGDVPILAGHAEELDSIAGQGQVETRDGKLYLSGVLTNATSQGEKIISLGRAGIKLQASIGIAPDKRETVSPGQKVSINGRTLSSPQNGLTIIRSGRLREVSLLAVGADAQTEVKISATARKPMNDTNRQQQDNPDTIRAAWDQPGMAPAERVKARYRALHLHDEHLREESQELMLRAAAGEIQFAEYDAAATRLELRDERLRATRAERPQGPAIRASRHDAPPDTLVAAFCRTAGLSGMEQHFDAPTLEAADRQYRGGVGLQELLLKAAYEAGYSGRPVIRSGNLSEVLRAAFSTHTITTAITSAGNKFLLDGFNAVEQVWRAISRTKPVRDFKEITNYRMTSDMVFEELPPGGEIQHGELGQESYTNQAKTYARMVTITRTDIINDDLGMFDDVRNRLGRGAGLKLNSVFWAAFLDNAAFFTTARGNLLEGAAYALAEDGDGLAAAEQLFLDLSDDDGHPLGITPALLLVPTALSVTARKLYASVEMRDTTSSTVFQVANLFYNRFKPLVSAYIGSGNTNGSDTHWFLIADPANLPLMEVAFLDGQQSPTIESADADFNTLGIQTRGFYDFGVARAEYRAGVKADGTD